MQNFKGKIALVTGATSSMKFSPIQIKGKNTMKHINVFAIISSLVIFSIPSYAAKTHTDEYYMERAIQMAKHNLNAPFGAVIVNNQTGKILCEGVNANHVNPTYHGEIVAINICAKK